MYRLLLLWTIFAWHLLPAAEAQIRYAPNPRFAPVDYVDHQKNHLGIMAGYLQLIQERADTHFIYTHYPVWEQIINALKTNKVDIVAGIHYNQEREQYAFFTERLFELPLFLVVRAGYSLPPNALKGIKIAGVRGYASTEYILATFPEAELLLFDSELEALMQTASGQTHATVTDLAAASAFIETYGLSNLKVGRMLDFSWDIRIAVSKKQPEIFAMLSEALDKITPAERDSLYHAYIGISTLTESSLLQRYRDEYVAAIWIIGLLIAAIIVFITVLRQQIRKKTKELKQQTERYQWATRASSDAIFELNGETGVIHFEENFRQLFGYDLTLNNNTIQQWWTYVHPQDLPDFQSAIKKAVKERQFFVSNQFRFLKADGTYAQVEARSYLLTNEQGRVSRVIGALQDTTRINQHVAAISEQNKRLREIAWMQSHIIRAPLARLMSLVMLLEFKDPETEQQREHIDHLILQSAKELDQVLQDIVSKSAEIKSEAID